MDGINPYSLQNTNYSIWPVVVINNNIPPWFSMKNEHLMLTLIVPGRRQVKNMDVYLQPLVDELKELWEGIHVYDVSRPIVMQEHPSRQAKNQCGSRRQLEDVQRKFLNF
jgi:hypothetical protein